MLLTVVRGTAQGVYVFAQTHAKVEGTLPVTLLTLVTPVNLLPYTAFLPYKTGKLT